MAILSTLESTSLDETIKMLFKMVQFNIKIARVVEWVTLLRFLFGV